MTTEKFNLICHCLKLIDEKADWSAFDDLVVNLKSHDAQADFLKKSVARENVLHPGNGWGKTDVFAKKHIRKILQHFIDGKKYRTLNIAITTEQAQLVQDRIVGMVESAPLLQKWFINKNGITKFPFPQVRYCNGAITEFKTTKRKGESVEGKEYGYISADEIALEQHMEFIREKILLPRLRLWPDSQMDIGATPKGMNAYYRIMLDVKRKGGFVRGGTSYENPYIDHKLLDYCSSTWSDAKINQIIKGMFIDTAEMMFASRVTKLFDESYELEECQRDHKYLHGWDLARGRKGSKSDQTVGYRIDITKKPYRIVKRWAFQLPWSELERENINNECGTIVEHSSIEREIRNAHNECLLNDCDVESYIDSTGVGDALYGIVQDIVKPVNFCGGRKDLILDNLQVIIDVDLLKSGFIPALADQMTVYQRDDKNLETDDVMALAVACSSIKVKGKKFGTFDG